MKTIDYIKHQPEIFKIYATHETDGPLEWLFNSKLNKYRISYNRIGKFFSVYVQTHGNETTIIKVGEYESDKLRMFLEVVN